MDHVVIFEPHHFKSVKGRPDLTVAVEARDRPGPAFKEGVFPDDTVWFRMGPLLVAKATVKIAWKGEYAFIRELRKRTEETELANDEAWWLRRPKIGYAVVAQLTQARYLSSAKLGGPRSYGYDWIVLDSESKRKTWLNLREPEPKDADLLRRFRELTA